METIISGFETSHQFPIPKGISWDRIWHWARRWVRQDGTHGSGCSLEQGLGGALISWKGGWPKGRPRQFCGAE